MPFKFAQGAGEPQSPRRPRNTTPRQQPLEDSPRGCEVCPLRVTWPTLSAPQMALHGEATSDILVMGEAPGAEEDSQGIPFVGPAGRLLHQVLPGRQAQRLALTNMVRCRPTTRGARGELANRPPSAREIHSCSLYLEDDIAAGRFKAILGLGGVPLSHFLNEASITQIHGLKFPVEIAGKVLWYYPTLHPSFVNRTRSATDNSPMMPIFENDIRNFFATVDRWQEPHIEKPQPKNVICAYTEQEARALCDQIKRAGKLIGFDIETHKLRPHAVDAEILTAAVSNGEITVAWPVYHPQMSGDWGFLLALEMTADMRWVAHNAAFELVWLREHAQRCSIPWEPAHGFEDSMVAMRLYQRRESCLNLGIGTRLYLGTNVKKLTRVNNEKIREEPLTEVLPYNGLDAYGCLCVFNHLRARVDSTVYYSLIATIQSTTEMQLLGLDVDNEAALALQTHWEGVAADAQAHARTVYEVKQYERERQTDFNIGSNEQVGDALVTYGRVSLPKTAEGNYKTDDATLTANTDSPLARDTLAFRHAKKMLSTYVNPLLSAPLRYVDKRIHPTYSTALTKTLRLSAEDPNIQNFPKRKDREVRTPIVPPKGCVFAAADYGQLEARVYAMASRDPALCASIIDNEDIHSYWLNIILERHPPYLERLAHKVTPNDTLEDLRKGGRDIIKSDFVFASFYGSGARNVAERAGLPPEIAADILAAFWRRYAQAQRWVQARRKEYVETGIARNLCGVERYGPMYGNEPINTPVQSTAARLVLDAQNEMYELYKKHGDIHMMPRINIHDDLTFALPDEDAMLMVYIEEISKVLVRVRYDFQIVPLKVEWKVGYNWAEMDDVAEFVGEYVR